MTATSAAFDQLRGDLEQLAGKAKPTEMSDAERIARAKHVFLKRTSIGLAMNLESCIHCGMCAEACHFYLATQDPRYAPVRKFQPLRRFYRRELTPMRWLNRLFLRDITVRDLEEWQELVYDSCTACGRCDMLCPMGIGISETVRLMREGLAAAGTGNTPTGERLRNHVSLRQHDRRSLRGRDVGGSGPGGSQA